MIRGFFVWWSLIQFALPCQRIGCAAIVFLVLGLAPVIVLRAQDGSAEQFERSIAPLLARRCLTCHSEGNAEGNLNLASHAAAKRGGDSGPAFIPANAEDSLLWQRVAAEEMPPDEPLSDEEKRVLAQWIAEGAVWGMDPINPFRYSSDERAGYDWWSLQPVNPTPVPLVAADAWSINPIDKFVFAKLQSHQLTPAAPAEPRVLLRRLYLDLIGMAPILSTSDAGTHEELLGIDIDLARFHRDPDYYASIVDRLLDSRHYGERWARHWLDVIRFGESQGFERNRIRENAWRFRDWVIEALNKDLPYDEFVRQQIAGDQLYPDDLDALIATGFLVCGTWDQVGHNEGSKQMQKSVRQDELEDLVATFGQSFLALTTNCARCHEHKFDPISQREYYQLAAALGGVTQEEKERGGISARPTSNQYTQWASQLAKLREEAQALRREILQNYGKTDAAVPVSEGLLGYWEAQKEEPIVWSKVRKASLLPPMQNGSAARRESQGPAKALIEAIQTSGEFSIELWITPGKAQQSGPARILTLSQDSGQRNFTLGQDGDRYDFRLRTTKRDNNGLPSTTSRPNTVTTAKTHVVVTFDKSASVRIYVNGQLSVESSVGGDLTNWAPNFKLALGDELNGGRVWDGTYHFLALYDRTLPAHEVRSNFDSESANVSRGESFEEVLERAPRPLRDRYRELSEQQTSLENQTPVQDFEGVAHVVIPKQPPTFHVLARGDFQKPQTVVAANGLEALGTSGLNADFDLAPDAPEGIRRVKLAEWVTDRRNPLTPRVIVNRLWHYHFGKGIVDTPSDFGFAGGRPSHPELLDWLANRFQEDGWKLKPIHRLIVCSATWRQSANVDNAAAEAIDADNRMLWRAHVRRLDGEAARDSMLAVSGALNRQFGGPSYRDVQVKLANNHEFTDPTGEFSPTVNRRTIYRLWARSGNNPLLESLDCPDPAVMLPQRPSTITPAQSLALFNSRFVEQCGLRLAELVQSQHPKSIDQQIIILYQRLFGRLPADEEIETTRAFVAKHGLQQLCIILLNTNEFLFVE